MFCLVNNSYLAGSLTMLLVYSGIILNRVNSRGYSPRAVKASLTTLVLLSTVCHILRRKY